MEVRREGERLQLRSGADGRGCGGYGCGGALRTPQVVTASADPGLPDSLLLLEDRGQGLLVVDVALLPFERR